MRLGVTHSYFVVLRPVIASTPRRRVYVSCLESLKLLARFPFVLSLTKDSYPYALASILSASQR